MNRSTLKVLCLGAALFGMGLYRTAGAQTLGVAGAFNVFIFNDNTQSGTDAQGRVAVGHNANFGSGYTVNSANVGGGYGLIVGNDYGNTYNTVSGGMLVGGNAGHSGPSITGNVAVNGNLIFSNYGTVNGNVKVGGTYTNPNTTVSGTASTGTTVFPFSFATVKSDLTAASAYYASLAATGTTSMNGNGIVLTGSSSGTNVFTVTAAQINNANSFTINAPSGSTALINFAGTSDQMVNFGFTLNGIDKQKVLYNFSNATSLLLNGVSVQGSILAPNATINFAGGNIDGTIIGNNISGSGESHNYLFTGTLPTLPTPAVPEPGTAAFLAGGGIGGLWLLRRRKK